MVDHLTGPRFEPYCRHGLLTFTAVPRQTQPCIPPGLRNGRDSLVHNVAGIRAGIQLQTAILGLLTYILSFHRIGNMSAFKTNC